MAKAKKANNTTAAMIEESISLIVKPVYVEHRLGARVQYEI